jgi:hypothetical protein
MLSGRFISQVALHRLSEDREADGRPKYLPEILFLRSDAIAQTETTVAMSGVLQIGRSKKLKSHLEFARQLCDVRSA